MITNPILKTPETGASGNAGVTFLQKALPAAVTLIIVVGVVVFFFMLVMGAIKWISSSGDKQALENARGTITNALIGIVVLLATFAIVRLIEHFFGISILTLDIGKLVIR